MFKKMKLKHIDSIRGIAIIMVIFGHIGQEIRGLSSVPHLLTSYGQMGVQLFFVASAYTLCLSTSNRISETQSLKKYAIRRFFRIAPVYYLGLLGYLLLELLLGWNKTGLFIVPEKYSVINILMNFLFFHGFYPPANNNIVPGGWSIGTEMAFYVLFPLLFLAAKKWATAAFGKALLLLFVLLCFSQLLIVLIAISSGQIVKNNSFMYYNLVNQIPVFCIGIIYYLYEKKSVFNFNWKFDLLAFLMFTSCSLILWNSNLQGSFSLIPFLSAISFVFLINIFKKIESLNFNYLIKLGTVSYSMYIIHFIFLNFSSKASLNLSDYLNKNILLILMFILTVIVTFAFAALSERYIEKPFINLGKKIILKMQ
jgi:peptidoglycan/LPS O-acetylase OafA/YrhL